MSKFTKNKAEKSENLFKHFVLRSNAGEPRAPQILPIKNEPNLKERLETDISSAIRSSQIKEAKNSTLVAMKGVVKVTLVGKKTSEFLGRDRGRITKGVLKQGIKLKQDTQDYNTKMLKEIQKYIQESRGPLDINKINEGAGYIYHHYQNEVITSIKEKNLKDTQKYDEQIKTDLDKAKKQKAKGGMPKAKIGENEYEGEKAIEALTREHELTKNRIVSDHTTLRAHISNMEEYTRGNSLPNPTAKAEAKSEPVASKEGEGKTKAGTISRLSKFVESFKKTVVTQSHDSSALVSGPSGVKKDKRISR